LRSVSSRQSYVLTITLFHTDSSAIDQTSCGAALARRSASGIGAALPLYHSAGHRQRTAQT